VHLYPCACRCTRWPGETTRWSRRRDAASSYINRIRLRVYCRSSRACCGDTEVKEESIAGVRSSLVRLRERERERGREKRAENSVGAHDDATRTVTADKRSRGVRNARKPVTVRTVAVTVTLFYRGFLPLPSPPAPRPPPPRTSAASPLAFVRSRYLRTKRAFRAAKRQGTTIYRDR